MPAAKAAGCEGAGFHDLRRANATALVRGGIDIRTTQALLRHSDARLTLNLYAEVEAEAERLATDQMAAKFLVPRRGPRHFRGMDQSGTPDQLGRTSSK